ncbi:hypothetical protein A2U01_0073105, partial [Trifolium medium]|nr:hypothetical protein [Trifolium medium]
MDEAKKRIWEEQRFGAKAMKKTVITI